MEEKPSLEYLLASKRQSSNVADSLEKTDTRTALQKTERAVSTYRANSGADLEKLMEMVARIISKSTKGRKLGIQFMPDEGTRVYADQNFVIDHPYVFYDVLSVTPSKEIKPRTREVFVEDPESTNSRLGTVQGQVFDAYVQFNIFACDYLQATAVMKFIEDLLFSYTAYFMQNGIAELIFHQRLTDKNLDLFRQKSSVRSLQYYVRYERNFVTYDQELAGVSIQ